MRWSTPAPTANDLRQELELTRFQVDRGSYATSSAPPTPTRTTLWELYTELAYGHVSFNVRRLLFDGWMPTDHKSGRKLHTPRDPLDPQIYIFGHVVP